jgi:hypothetical protein
MDAVAVKETSPDTPLLARSHFGFGILTFHVNALFRTEPGYDLLVTGPFNQPKDGIQPLTGIVETDWAPFTFTMNWKFTRRDTPIAFAANEPFCMIFPVARGSVEQVEAEFRDMQTDSRLKEAYIEWVHSRKVFNDTLPIPGSEAHAQKWQKEYFQGLPRAGARPDDHRTKIRAKPFAYRSEK